MLLLCALLLGGCLNSARRAPLPVSAEDNTARLIQHPQFQAAAQVSPDFVEETFRTITRLEKEKANAGR